jgi:N-acyl-phosphatidylethanolamine-hydrolysing phospholipase D
MLPLMTYARLVAPLAAAVLGSAPAIAALADVPPPASAHHRDGGFQNNDIAFEPKGLGPLLRWRFEALRDGKPAPAATPTPMVAPDLAFIGSNARAGLAMEPAVTWVGHATVLAQMGGLNILTDPAFSDRVSPFSSIGPKRFVAPGVSLAQLPHIDAVLVSHNHYDHLDERSVRALNAQPGGPPLFLVPLGNRAWMLDRGISNVIELDWWQAHRLGEVELVLTPVQHWSGRGLTDRLSTLWGGWAVFAPDLHLFFTGDTGYSRDFTRIRERFAPRQRPGPGGGFDIALIAVGAYEPRWFMADQHVNPAEAVQIHLDVAARRSLGIHWGTFALTDESLDTPPLHLAQARRDKGVADEDFFVVAIGETRKLPRRPPAP